MDRHQDELQHEVRQSRLAMEAKARGEKTGEREGVAAVNGGDGDTPFTNRRGENSSARSTCSVQARHVKPPANHGFERKG